MAERPLSVEEAALWGRVVETVAPLPGRQPTPVLALRSKARPAGTIAIMPPSPRKLVAGGIDGTLDGSWDRRLSRGLVQPDRSIDLHGLTLDRAYGAIDAVLEAAIRDGNRVLLMVTGKARPDARGDAGAGRGAIRAVVGDWLAASRHAAWIATVRNAHPRHGGAGALYVVLRRR